MENCARCNPVDRNSQLCTECFSLLQTRIDAILEEELPQNEGYDSALFVDPFPDHYECSLCMGAFRDPVHIVDCGHVFCKTCLNRATEGERMCPNHRGKPFTRTFPDQAKKREVLSLKVRCRKEGCKWNGELSDLHDHLNRRCLKIQLSCINKGCLEVLLREDFSNHLLDHCPFRLTKCDFCELFVKSNELKKHTTLVCERFPVPCEFACGKKFPRNEISEHGLACQKRPLSCVYANFGCPFKGEKTLLSTHLKNAVSEHLEKTTRRIRGHETKIEELTMKHANLLNSTTEQIRELQTKSNEQENILKTKLDQILVRSNNNHNDRENFKYPSTKSALFLLICLVIAFFQLEIFPQNNIFTKYKDLSTKHEYLFTKYKDLSTKHETIFAKHEDLSTKHKHLFTKHEDLQTKYEVLRTELKKTQAVVETLRKETDQIHDLYSNIKSYWKKLKNAVKTLNSKVCKYFGVVIPGLGGC